MMSCSDSTIVRASVAITDLEQYEYGISLGRLNSLLCEARVTREHLLASAAVLDWAELFCPPSAASRALLAEHRAVYALLAFFAPELWSIPICRPARASSELALPGSEAL